MCGILYCKIKSNLIPQEKFKGIFEEALSKMKYRGPDATGMVVSDTHYFGHVRLSIIDLTEASCQPYEDNENLLIFNGEIYNYKSIDPLSSSDTATLFNIMKTSGAPFQEIRGTFAFGWYNKQKQEVTFYRDFFGEKPLYYYSDDDVDIAASTLKSIVHIVNSLEKNIKLNINEIQNNYLLFGYIREPLTIWEKIYILPPGHQLTFNSGKIEIKPIVFNIKSTNFPWTDSNYIRESLSSKDVEGAVLLSGGVDSCFVVSQALRHKVPLRIGLYKATDPSIDESKAATINLTKIHADPSYFPLTILSDKNQHGLDIDYYSMLLEQPSSDGLQIFYLLRFLRDRYKGLKLVFTGLGGDELFGGYPTFYNYYIISVLLRIPAIDYFLPSIRRFKEGFKVLRQWDAEVYCFLYRLNYSLFMDMGRTSDDLKKLYLDYKQTSAMAPAEVTDRKNENTYYTIKRNETFQYCKNQLIRDNDNIAMYLGFESRSPLLNPDWYLQHDRKKKKLKAILNKKYHITFGRKKGFTLDESNSRQLFLQYIQQNRVWLNSILPKFTEDFLKKLPNSQLRSVAILSGWLKYNMGHITV